MIMQMIIEVVCVLFWILINEVPCYFINIEQDFPAYSINKISDKLLHNIPMKGLIQKKKLSKRWQLQHYIIQIVITLSSYSNIVLVKHLRSC